MEMILVIILGVLILFALAILLLKITVYFFGYSCDYCGTKTIYKCITYTKETKYVCPECMRAVRFREYDFYDKIEAIKDNRFQSKRI